MADETPTVRKQQFAPKANRTMDIGALISAPLVAATTANNRMASEQVKFLMDFCFAMDPKGGPYRPVTIALEYTRSFMEPPPTPGDDPVYRSVTSEFQMPLLTLVNLNALAVDSVKVDFEMEVTTQTCGGAQPQGTDGEGAHLMGKISYDSTERSSQSSDKRDYSSRNNSSLKVSVNASQLPLPKGVALVLDMYTRAAHPVAKNT